MTLEELQTMRDTLRAARYNGALTVRAGDKWVTYKSDRVRRSDSRQAAAAASAPTPRKRWQ